MMKLPLGKCYSSIVLLGLFLGFNLNLHAQISNMEVVPAGSAIDRGTILGDTSGGGANCAEDTSCAMKIDLKVFCYGSNLRQIGTALDPKKDVVSTITLTKSGTSKVAKTFRIVFPADLTYGEESMVTCSVPAGASTKFNAGNPKYPVDSYTYSAASCDIMLSNTGKAEDQVKVGRVNLSFDVSKQSDYKIFYFESTPATKLQIDAPYDKSAEWESLLTQVSSGINSKVIQCKRYFEMPPAGAKMDSYKHTMSATRIECLFPTLVKDKFTPMVKIYPDSTGTTELSADQVTKYVSLNNIVLQFSKGGALALESVQPTFDDTKKQVTSSPAVSVSFSQSGTAISVNEKERAWGSSAADYTTLKLLYGLPGGLGFCGGYVSPLMIFLGEKRPIFTGQTSFPLYPDVKRIYWPEPGYAEAFFLALPKGKKKEILSGDQLFGQNKLFANGFEALKIHDKNKDDKIDAKDAIFKKLVLWNDFNGDGKSERGEIYPLSKKGIVEINLKYKSFQYHFDRRATYRERSTVSYRDPKNKTELKTADIIDVWFSAYSE
ncbi:MAG: hypothetical protein HQK50_18095 [Oligoflexia bacterium]|nr:hypothetical protein [Oligoflexia bacterium]